MHGGGRPHIAIGLREHAGAKPTDPEDEGQRDQPGATWREHRRQGEEADHPRGPDRREPADPAGREATVREEVGEDQQEEPPQSLDRGVRRAPDGLVGDERVHGAGQRRTEGDEHERDEDRRPFVGMPHVDHQRHRQKAERRDDLQREMVGGVECGGKSEMQQADAHAGSGWVEQHGIALRQARHQQPLTRQDDTEPEQASRHEPVADEPRRGRAGCIECARDASRGKGRLPERGDPAHVIPRCSFAFDSTQTLHYCITCEDTGARGRSYDTCAARHELPFAGASPLDGAFCAPPQARQKGAHAWLWL